MGLVVEMIGRRTVNPILICTEPKESMTSIVCVHLHVVPMHGDALIGWESGEIRSLVFRDYLASSVITGL